jgi:hypoxanthine phosphoribosyltransferase
MDFRYIIMVAISGGGGVVGVVMQPVLKTRLVASSRPENVFLFFM